MCLLHMKHVYYLILCSDKNYKIYDICTLLYIFPPCLWLDFLKSFFQRGVVFMWLHFGKNRTYKHICQTEKRTWKDTHQNVHSEYLWVVELWVIFLSSFFSPPNFSIANMNCIFIMQEKLNIHGNKLIPVIMFPSGDLHLYFSSPREVRQHSPFW